jgi:tellurite resistance protein
MTAATDASTRPAEQAPVMSTSRLANMPVSLFAMVMGTTGVAIAWEKTGRMLGFGPGPGAVLTLAITVLFAVLLAAYGVKVVRYRSAVLAELRHPVKLSFFPTISISFLLLSVAFLNAGDDEPWRSVSQVLWIIGTAAHLAFTLSILGTWMHADHFRVEHMNPAWFIPAVGNMLVPVAGVPLGFLDISWFFFAIGLVSWIVLLAIVVNRVLFHEAVESRLLPSFFILIAPPAVGFIAWVRLNGPDLDAAGRILYSFALFLGLLLLTRVRTYARLPFGLPSWAFSFPIAALAIATLLVNELGGGDIYLALGLVLVAVATAVVTILAVLTAREAMAGRICVPGR